MKITDKFDYFVVPAIIVVIAIALYGLFRLFGG